MGKPSVKLQVLICTYGAEGIQRIADASHPRVEGVEYLVAWQNSQGIAVPEVLRRDDFLILRTATKGLSKNRNFALSHASAPIAVIADDDLTYTADTLKRAIAAFENHPEADIITFRYDCDEFPPSYPAPEFSLNRPPKGYHPVSFEIGFRTSKVAGHYRFNESFGIGALFPSGEEDLFLHDLIAGGLKGIHVNHVLARHHGPTTADRANNSRAFTVTKGAVFSRLFPLTWWMRMLTHAYRHTGGNVAKMKCYCRKWLAGVALAHRHRVFK